MPKEEKWLSNQSIGNNHRSSARNSRKNITSMSTIFNVWALITSKKALVIILLWRKRCLQISLEVGDACRRPFAHHWYDIFPNQLAIIQFLFSIDSPYSLEMRNTLISGSSYFFQCLLAFCPYNFRCSVCLLHLPPVCDSRWAICQSLHHSKGTTSTSKWSLCFLLFGLPVWSFSCRTPENTWSREAVPNRILPKNSGIFAGTSLSASGK